MTELGAQLIIPLAGETSQTNVVIDGVTYRTFEVDDSGKLAVAVASLPLPSGAATSAKQDTMITSLQLIDDLRNALASVAGDQLRADIISSALPSGAATSAKQDTMITALQLIDDLRAALASVATDRLRTQNELQALTREDGYVSDTGSPSDEQVLAAPGASKVRYLTSLILSTDAAGYFYLHTATSGGSVKIGPLFFGASDGIAIAWPDGFAFGTNVPLYISGTCPGSWAITVTARAG